MTDISFIRELLGRAASSALASMSTSALALLFGLGYGTYKLVLSYRENRWPGVRAHFVKDAMQGLIFGIGWWALLFSYHLFYKVPSEIRAQAAAANPPMLGAPPSVPMEALYLVSEPLRTVATGCIVRGTSTSEVFARLYARGDIRSTPSAEVPFDFQELFYDWKGTFVPDRALPKLEVRVGHLTPDDAVQTDPKLATQGSLEPEWFSGFKEPARQKADFYSQTITFEHLDKGERAIVIVRRRLEVPDVTPVGIIRVDDVRNVEDCPQQLPHLDENKEAKSVSAQAVALASFKYGRTGGSRGSLPLRNDPGDVSPNEVQATVEPRCANLGCTRGVMKNLEVHMGKPPAQYFQNQ